MSARGWRAKVTAVKAGVLGRIGACVGVGLLWNDKEEDICVMWLEF